MATVEQKSKGSHRRKGKGSSSRRRDKSAKIGDKDDASDDPAVLEKRRAALAVLPTGIDLPNVVAAAVWDVGVSEARHTLKKLSKTPPSSEMLPAVARSVKDKHAGFMVSPHTTTVSAEQHAAVVDGFAQRLLRPDNWCSIEFDFNCTYYWTSLPQHLIAAGRTGDAAGLLMSWSWIVELLRRGLSHELLQHLWALGSTSASLLPDIAALSTVLTLPMLQLPSPPTETTSLPPLPAAVAARLAYEIASVLSAAASALSSPAAALLTSALSHCRLRPVPGSARFAPAGLQQRYAGHLSGIAGIVLVPGHIVSAGRDGAVCVWNRRTGQLVQRFVNTPDALPVSCVVATSVGCVILGSSADADVRLWRAMQGSMQATIATGHNAPVTCLALTRDDRTLVTGSRDKDLRIWKLAGSSADGDVAAEAVGVLSGHKAGVSCCAISTDGKYCVSGADDGVLRVWNMEKQSKSRSLKQHTARVTSIAVVVSAGGLYAVSGAEDACVVMWDLKKGDAIHILPTEHGPVTALAPSMDGRLFMVAFPDTSIRVYDRSSGDTVTCTGVLMGGHGARVTSITASSYDQLVAGDDAGSLSTWQFTKAVPPEHVLASRVVGITAACQASDGTVVVVCADNTVLALDTAANSLPAPLASAGSGACCIAAHDAAHLLVGYADGSVRVCRAAASAYEQVAQLKAPSGVACVAVGGASGATIAAGASEQVCVWTDAARAGPEPSNTWQAGMPVTSMAVLGSGHHAILAGGRTINVLDLRDGKVFRNITEQHDGEVAELVLTPDSEVILTRSVSGVVHVWRWRGGELLRSFPIAGMEAEVYKRPGCMAVLPDSAHIVVCVQRQLQVWQYHTKRFVCAIDCEDEVLGVAVSRASSQILAVTSSHHIIHLDAQVYALDRTAA